jgi:hypothetical protein
MSITFDCGSEPELRSWITDTFRALPDLYNSAELITITIHLAPIHGDPHTYAFECHGQSAKNPWSHSAWEFKRGIRPGSWSEIINMGLRLNRPRGTGGKRVHLANCDCADATNCPNEEILLDCLFFEVPRPTDEEALKARRSIVENLRNGASLDDGYHRERLAAQITGGLVGEDRALLWSDVEQAIPDIFGIWVSGKEKTWAKAAWEHVIDAGLSSYRDAGTEAIAVFRFLALGSTYCDFCAKAADEIVEPEYTSWIQHFGVDAFTIGRLSAAVQADDEDAALRALVLAQRPAVLQAITKGFGGVDRLFESLWLTIEKPADPADVLGYPTLEKMAAYEWLVNRSPKLL